MERWSLSETVCPDALAQVHVRLRSEMYVAFVTAGVLSAAEVAPTYVCLVVGKVADTCQSAFEPTRSLLVALVAFILPFECGDPAPVLRLLLCVKVSEAAKGEISLRH